MAPEANSPDNEPMPLDHVLYWKFQGLMARIPRFIRGLTLVEWLVILSIVGILSGLLMPSTRPNPHRFPRPRPNPGNDFAPVAATYLWIIGRHSFHSLEILADGRYSYTGDGSQESGWVHREGEDLTFTSNDIDKSLDDRTLRPIRWGSRNYLVPPGSIGNFCSAILLGHEPRSELKGDFPFAGNNDNITGLPVLPEPWGSYLRENIVLGTVIEASPDSRVMLDVGLAEGVNVGDIFAFPSDSWRGPWQWIVVFASDVSCELELLNPAPYEYERFLERNGILGRQLAKSLASPPPEFPEHSR